MPTYEFLCASCGARRYLQVRFDKGDGPVSCLECGAEAWRYPRLYAPSIHFKGTGWGGSKSAEEHRRSKND